MKTNVSTALATFLDGLCQSGNGGQYTVIDLYQIVLLNGYTLRLAAWPLPVVYNGHTYSASGPYVSRSMVKQSLKLAVSQIKMKLFATPEMLIGSQSVLSAIAAGMFSGAAVTVYRLFSSTAFPLDMSLGAVIWFVGNVAEVEDISRGSATLSVKDPTALLGVPYPPNLYTTGCRYTLFDRQCTLSASSFQISGTVGSGATTVTIPTSLNATLYPGILAAPTGKPTLSYTSPQPNVNLQTQNYFCVVTYVGKQGESQPSPENSLWVGDTRVLLNVASPPSSLGATGWNCYLSGGSGATANGPSQTPVPGTGSNNEQLQNATPIAIGSPFQLTGQGLLQGSPPPFTNASGWFTLGQITFTSGANAGIQRYVKMYDTPGGVGIVTVLPPLPVAPSSGDAFVILPGCDKTIVTCQQKFNNLINIGAQPWIPEPQQVV